MTDPSRPSRFGGLAKLRQQGEVPADEAEPIAESAPTPKKKRGTRTVAPAEARAGEKVTVQQIRERGKKSDPSFVQVGAYVRRSTYQDVKRRLFDDPERDFSDVVEALLAGWIAGRYRA